MNDWKKRLSHPALIVVAGLALGIGAVFGALNSNAGVRGKVSGLAYPAASAKLAGAPAPGNLEALRQMDTTFADISETASRAVVSIRSSRGGQMGEGSGFIYRADGWIVTNDHVVGGSTSVSVMLNDGRELEGKVYRANDDQVDLALVKVNANDLPVLPMANSDLVRPGQFTLAIGAPFGLENTVTVGHVSALGRGSSVSDPEFGDRGYIGMIQTDAPINPGNSGGPLINIDGEVIGVNSTIFSTNMASAGIGFAIPAKVVSAVADELIKTGKFDRGLIGAFIDDLKPFQKKELKLEGGAILSETVPEGTPAYQAGLRKGDVITRIDGDPLGDQMDLRVALYKKSPKDNVSITYVRDGQIKETKLALDAPATPVATRQPRSSQMPEDLNDLFRGMPFDRMNPESGSQPETRTNQKATIGINVRAVDETTRKQFGLPENATGVVVMAVEAGSFAAKYGLKAGDLVTRINSVTIKSLDDVRKASADLRVGDQLTLSYMRSMGGSMSEGTLSAPL